MQGKLVTIIIPMHNAEKFIDQTLESLCGQSYTTIEILCVDDGSHDKTRAKVKAWSALDDRVVLLEHQHSGVAAARNYGILYASGSYVVFADADDCVDTDYIATMVRIQQQTSVDVVATSYTTDRHEMGCLKDETVSIITSSQGRVDVLTHAIPSAVWGKLFTVKSLQKVSFSSRYVVGEDIFFMLDVMNNCKTIATTPYKAVFYRKHSGNAVKYASLDARMTLISALYRLYYTVNHPRHAVSMRIYIELREVFKVYHPSTLNHSRLRCYVSTVRRDVCKYHTKYALALYFPYSVCTWLHYGLYSLRALYSRM